MKKLVLLVAVVFGMSILTGCGKKKETDMSMEGLNGVVSENVVSVMDAGTGAGDVPVYVENAENAAMPTDMENAAVEAATAVVGKPTSKQIQQALKNAGFYAGKVDGDIGPKTKKAIEAFQAQNGLKADGKVGAKTWKILATYLSKSTEVVNPSQDVQILTQ